jgi:hypothetical protein
MPGSLGSSDQSIVQTDQNQRTPQRQFEVSGVVRAQGVRLCQAVESHKVSGDWVKTNWQFRSSATAFFNHVSDGSSG